MAGLELLCRDRPGSVGSLSLSLSHLAWPLLLTSLSLTARLVKSPVRLRNWLIMAPPGVAVGHVSHRSLPPPIVRICTQLQGTRYLDGLV